MDKITVFDLKKLGLITNDADDIYVASEINQKLEDGDILGAFDMVAHADEIDELEDYLEEANDELEDVKDQLFYAENEKEETEKRVNYLEDILNKHNISY